MMITDSSINIIIICVVLNLFLKGSFRFVANVLLNAKGIPLKEDRTEELTTLSSYIQRYEDNSIFNNRYT